MAQVLIADDDPQFTAAFQSAMEALGHETTVRHNGDAAVEALREGAFDIVFLDVLMPGGGAISLLHRLRELDATVPVVVITGNAAVFGAPIVTEGLRRAQARIPKTASLSELGHLIDELVAQP